MSPLNKYMIYDFQLSKDYLRHEFETRIRKNPRYSMRSFALFLKIHPAELSQIFSGKRNLSVSSAKKVSQALGLSADENKQLFLLLQKEKGQQLGLDLEFNEDMTTPNLPEETFAKISQWFHFAILNLVETKDFEWSARHVAKRLAISQSEASLAMSDLQKLGLVQVSKLTNTSASKKKIVVASPTMHSASIRKYHQQMLERAKISLDETPLDRREFQSIGFVTSTNEIPSLKQDIDEFTNKIIKKYHKSKSSEVYQLQLCLFPLTKENQA